VSQMYLVHALTSYFNAHFNIIFPCIPVPSERSLIFTFPN
jgi:hypothetical protein